MADAKSVINLGLSKISASRVTSIAPAKSSLEKHCADNYPVWRDNELELRTWFFSLQYAKLTLSPEANPVNVGDGRVYRYSLPNDLIRPIRDKTSEWQQRRKYIYSAHDELTIEYVARIPENDWPATFQNVVACRVAKESVEYVTQSNTKGESAEQKYNKALSDAAAANSFVKGSSDIRTTDADEWLQARLGYGAME